MPTPVTPSRPHVIWWLNPGKLLLFFVLPLYTFMAGLVPLVWPQLIVLRYGTYLDAPYVVLGGLTLIAAGGGALLGSAITVGSGATERLEMNPRFLYGVALLALFAYLIWFGPLLASGQLLAKREELNQIPGVTSLTQLGVPFVICYLHCRLRVRQPLPRSLHLLFTAIMLFTLLRVFAWSERLAMIEIGVPASVLVLTNVAPRRGLGRALFSVVRSLGPLLAIPLLLGFFSLTEFFRSWSAPSYQSQQHDLMEFMVSRLVTYYYTALNNGAGLLATTDWPARGMVHMLDWAYRLPFGLGELLWKHVGPHDSPDVAFLLRFADPEFNNMSGIFPPFYDLGVALGLVYFATFGFCAGLVYRAMLTGHRLGVVLYPIFYVACLEILRISYLHGPRAFVIWFGSLVALTQLRSFGVRLVADRALPASRLLAR